MGTIQHLPGMVRVLEQLRRVRGQGKDKDTPIIVTDADTWEVRTNDFTYAVEFPAVIPPGAYWGLMDLLPLFKQGLGTMEHTPDVIINGRSMNRVAPVPQPRPDPLRDPGWTMAAAITPGEWQQLRHGLSKDKSRPLLQHVGIFPGYAVSSDGILLIRVDGIGSPETPAMDLPWFPLTGDALLWVNGESWILSGPQMWAWGHGIPGRYPLTERIWPTEQHTLSGMIPVRDTLAQWTAMHRVGWKDRLKTGYATLSGYVRVSDKGWAKATEWLPADAPDTSQRIAWDPACIVRAFQALPNPQDAVWWRLYDHSSSRDESGAGALLRLDQGNTHIIVMSRRGLVSPWPGKEDDHHAVAGNE